MRSGNRSNALLVELLIVVMFFMLSATVLLQVFATARNQSAQAGRLTEALGAAQNTADRLYAAQDAGEALREMGFEEKEGVWRLSGEEFDVTVAVEETQTASGLMRRHQVQAVRDGQVLVDLPSARYQEVRQ